MNAVPLGRDGGSRQSGSLACIMLTSEIPYIIHDHHPILTRRVGGTPDYHFGHENQQLLETLVFPMAFDWE